MEKLISMTDFVLEQRLSTEEINSSSFYEIKSHIYKYYDKIFAYANFLKQPLQLGFFVPCDLDGNILKEIELHKCVKKCTFKNDYKTCCEHKNIYEAMSRVLFKGFEIETVNIKENITAEILKLDKCRVFWKDGGYWNKSGLHNTIEDLVKYNLELTESAKKQIGIS